MLSNVKLFDPNKHVLKQKNYLNTNRITDKQKEFYL